MGEKRDVGKGKKDTKRKIIEKRKHIGKGRGRDGGLGGGSLILSLYISFVPYLFSLPFSIVYKIIFLIETSSTKKFKAT